MNAPTIHILKLSVGHRYKLRDGRVARVTTLITSPTHSAVRFVTEHDSGEPGAAVTEMPVAGLLALIVEELPHE